MYAFLILIKEYNYWRLSFVKFYKVKKHVSEDSRRWATTEIGNIMSPHINSYYNGHLKNKIWTYNIMRAKLP